MKASSRRLAIGAAFVLSILFALPSRILAGSREQFGAQHPEILTGKWTLSLEESSLGSDPYEQFDDWTLTFTQVTKTALAWSSNATIHGNALAFSWAGPIDGSQKPLIGLAGSDAYRWRMHALIRLSDLGHGETKRDTVTISANGEVMTIRDRSKTSHGVAFATLVMHRQQ